MLCNGTDGNQRKPLLVSGSNTRVGYLEVEATAPTTQISPPVTQLFF